MRTHIVYAPEVDTVSALQSGILPFSIKAFTTLEEAKAWCTLIKPHIINESTVEIVTVKLTTNRELASFVNTLLTQQKVNHNG